MTPHENQFIEHLADWLFGPADPEAITVRTLSRHEFLLELRALAKRKGRGIPVREYGIRKPLPPL